MYLQLVRAFWCFEQRYLGPVLENAPESTEREPGARTHFFTRTHSHTRGSGAVDVAVGGAAALGGNTQAVQQEPQQRFKLLCGWFAPTPNQT